MRDTRKRDMCVEGNGPTTDVPTHSTVTFNHFFAVIRNGEQRIEVPRKLGETTRAFQERVNLLAQEQVQS